MTFKALVARKTDRGEFSVGVESLTEDQLPAGEVTVDIAYSTINYKDGLCLQAHGGGMVRAYPHVPGIDFAGFVASSDDVRYKPGDEVVLTGWRLGETPLGRLFRKGTREGRLACPIA